MQPCAADAADPFAASRTAFDALAVELGAEGAAGLGHAELEDLVLSATLSDPVRGCSRHGW